VVVLLGASQRIALGQCAKVGCTWPPSGCSRTLASSPRRTSIFYKKWQASCRPLPVLGSPGGDWNGSPEELAASGWLNLVGGVVAAPALPTCHESSYDYFVVSRSLAHAVYRVIRISDGDFTPHYPTRLLLRSNPRAILVRQLRRPRMFAAAVPFGPLDQRHDAETPFLGVAAASSAELDLHEEYARWLRAAEAHLSHCSCHDPDEVRAHGGRAEGPACV
jgi:hypothetical protein